MKRTLKKGLKVYEPAGCGEKLNLGNRLHIWNHFLKKNEFLTPVLKHGSRSFIDTRA